VVVIHKEWIRSFGVQLSKHDVCNRMCNRWLTWDQLKQGWDHWPILLDCENVTKHKMAASSLLHYLYNTKNHGVFIYAKYIVVQSYSCSINHNLFYPAINSCGECVCVCVCVWWVAVWFKQLGQVTRVRLIRLSHLWCVGQSRRPGRGSRHPHILQRAALTCQQIAPAKPPTW